MFQLKRKLQVKYTKPRYAKSLKYRFQLGGRESWTESQYIFT